MSLEKVNIVEKFTKFSDYWSPKIVGELNGQVVKLAKFKGEFIWHKHEEEDEMFYIVEGELKIAFRDKEIIVKEKEFIIIPKGVEHKPIAENEVSVMLFEPKTVLNTGDQLNDRTVENQYL
ncbi:uncharacterized protein UJ101_00081 [Flavobacteriaceae bacterium UJ101]|nr:uncharacterized protein UJ101_00081 [Flavobacteriaceae bacterium UJ101]